MIRVYNRAGWDIYDEAKEPVEVEVEKYTEEDYDEMLDELYGPFKIGYINIWPSEALFKCDPIAYRCGFSDCQEYETKYKCPICDEQFDTEDDAKWHCQEEYEEEEIDE